MSHITAQHSIPLNNNNNIWYFDNYLNDALLFIYNHWYITYVNSRIKKF